MRLAPLIISATIVLVGSPVFAQSDDGGAEVIELDGPTAQPASEGEAAESNDEAPPPAEPYDEPAPSPGEQLAAQAEDAFVAGDYQRAIDLLQQAYDAEQNPNMLYNIARVHEERGDLENALEFYRRFVVAPNVDLDYRREALQSSELIEQTLAARAKAEQEAAEVATESDQVTQEKVMYRPAPFPTTSPMRPLGFVLAAVGGATVLSGVAVGIAALQKEGQFEEAGTLAQRREAGASARDLATAADALYISGAVLIVTGLVTAYASPRRERSAISRNIDFKIRGDGVGAAWTVRF